MIKLEDFRLGEVAIHGVGNKVKGESLRLSAETSGTDGETTKALQDVLRQTFSNSRPYQFGHRAGLEYNSVYGAAKRYFEGELNLLDSSTRFAQLLYEASEHPNIKSGDFLVIGIERLHWEAGEHRALALIKSEDKQTFLFTEDKDDTIELYSYPGIAPGKIDKACLIIDKNAEKGFEVLALEDRRGKEESKFWFERFLGLRLLDNAFNSTKEAMQYAKRFIETEPILIESYETPERELHLDKSKRYFEERDSFDTNSFAEEVFDQPAIQERFQSYFSERFTANELQDAFEISPEVVKNQQKIFKSVLKLDKNFHVYIHGNRQMIERGQDADGRKFYKLYYEEEN